MFYMKRHKWMRIQSVRTKRSKARGAKEQPGMQSYDALYEYYKEGI